MTAPRGSGSSGARSPGELDVDARFLLANERTLLAWVRTALTLLAAGVAVQQFGTGTGGRVAVTVVLLALGALAGALGGLRYVHADQALREGRLPATGRAPAAVAAGVVLVAVGLLVAALVDVR
ncbi:MAG: DUF202 domain-containing protein [Actinomycetota bacterium]|nr:DUF202 domain-containing protein [Actinomycetota bacterium]